MYPELIYEFVNWLKNYCVDEQDLEMKLKNNKMYNINKKEDYCLAIIEYISGMTDDFFVNEYNKLSS